MFFITNNDLKRKKPFYTHMLQLLYQPFLKWQTVYKAIEKLKPGKKLQAQHFCTPKFTPFHQLVAWTF